MLRRYHLGFGNKLIDPNTGEWAAVPDNGGGIFWGGMAGTTSMILQSRWDEVNIAWVFNQGGKYDTLATELEDIVDSLSTADWGL